MCTRTSRLLALGLVLTATALTGCVEVESHVYAQFDRVWTTPSLLASEESYYSLTTAQALNRIWTPAAPLEIALPGPDAYLSGVSDVQVRLPEVPRFHIMPASGVFTDTPTEYHYAFRWTCDWPAVEASFRANLAVGAARTVESTAVRASYGLEGETFLVLDKYYPERSHVAGFVVAPSAHIIASWSGARWLQEAVERQVYATIQEQVVEESLRSAMRRALREQFGTPNGSFEDDVVHNPQK